MRMPNVWPEFGMGTLSDMAEPHNVLDGILAELKASQDRRLAAERQTSADAAESAPARVLPAAWARQFVQELADQCVVLETRLGPELGRPVPMRVDQVMNPFHGTHHDYRVAVRVSQHEL